MLPHVAADDSEKDEEWDLNGPRDVMDIIDHKIPFHDVENARFTMPQFAKVSACYIELLKKKSPKAPLSQHFQEDVDKRVFSSSKQRIAWLSSFAAQRAKQFLIKLEKAKTNPAAV